MASNTAPGTPSSMFAKIVNSLPFSIGAPAAVGVAMAALCIRQFELYGVSLFLGVPVVVGFLSAFCFAFQRRVSFGAAYGVSVLSLVFLGSLAVVFALDGL